MVRKRIVNNINVKEARPKINISQIYYSPLFEEGSGDILTILEFHPVETYGSHRHHYYKNKKQLKNIYNMQPFNTCFLMSRLIAHLSCMNRDVMLEMWWCNTTPSFQVDLFFMEI